MTKAIIAGVLALAITTAAAHGQTYLERIEVLGGAYGVGEQCGKAGLPAPTKRALNTVSRVMSAIGERARETFTEAAINYADKWEGFDDTKKRGLCETARDIITNAEKATR